MSQGNRIRSLALTGLLTALALVLGYAERLIPIDFAMPGIRLGLANVVVVSGLYLFRPRQAFLIALLKSGTTFLVNASPLGFLYGLTGTLLSFAVMLALKSLLGEEVSPIGISIVGGMFHIVGQIAAAVLVTSTPLLFWYLPVLLISGAVTGALIGVTVRGCRPHLDRISRTIRL